MAGDRGGFREDWVRERDGGSDEFGEVVGEREGVVAPETVANGWPNTMTGGSPSHVGRGRRSWPERA
jgi:hypothetical protein